MITRLMVIQKVKADGTVEVFQISSDNFQWTFETRRTRIDTDKDYYPFCLRGEINVLVRQAGAETRTYVRENELTFCDDYGVPEGTVVAVLFPDNYVPDIIKFKDKPYLPIGFAGQVTTRPPGQIQVLYNHLAKKCAIVFNIHENIVFGFKCIARLVNDEEFPRTTNVVSDDLFDITLSKDFLNVEAITTDDLKIINETLNHVDLADIQQTLNELLTSLKAGQKEKSKSLLNRSSVLLLNAASVSSSLITIADSYKTGGAAKSFIGRVIEYASL